MLKFDVITLFPQLFETHIEELPFKRAIDKKLISTNLHNLREFSKDKYGTVDDKPYGGGVGMILMLEPLYKCLHKIYSSKEDYEDIIGKEELVKIKPKEKHKIILLSPKGNLFNQSKARELAKMEQLTLVSGRYEGIDERVKSIANVEPISIGNYVLSGGELPSLVIMESITRLIPGVLEKQEATDIESFSNNNLEYPQYTRPENFKGVKVPDVLLSGHHEKINEWRKRHTTEITQN